MCGFVNFRVVLTAKGLRFLDLARAAGVSQPQLSLVVNGHVEPDPEFRRKCAEALGVPESWLFRRTRRIPTVTPAPEAVPAQVAG